MPDETAPLCAVHPPLTVPVVPRCPVCAYLEGRADATTGQPDVTSGPQTAQDGQTQGTTQDHTQTAAHPDWAEEA